MFEFFSKCATGKYFNKLCKQTSTQIHNSIPGINAFSEGVQSV